MTSGDSLSDLVQGPPLCKRLCILQYHHSLLLSSRLINDATLFLSLSLDKDSKLITDISPYFDRGGGDGVGSPWFDFKKQAKSP